MEDQVQEQPNMPKVTPGVWIALVTAALGVATSFGADLSTEQQASITVLAGAIIAIVPIVELKLRRARLDFLSAQQSVVDQRTIVVNTQAEDSP